MGYPNEELLNRIKGMMPAQAREMLELIVQNWEYEDRACEVRPGLFVFSTGGWSGNEDLLEAMFSSIAYAANSDKILLPGGLCCIAIDPEAKQDMRNLHQAIVKWAWAREQLHSYTPKELVNLIQPDEDN